MNTNRSCGCKSFRTCRLCEAEYGLQEQDNGHGILDNRQLWEYDLEAGRCTNNKGEERDFPGIKIIPDFITASEEADLVKGLDLLPWDSSVSGRRKQNFGPRANFNKRKAKLGPFAGFPPCTKFIQDRFSTVPLLESYRTVEQCSIEYRPETGASIEPHIDDCWIWGERIVQLNLLSGTSLTLTPYTGSDKPNKYNLGDVNTYPRVIGHDGRVGERGAPPFCVDVPPSLYPTSALVRIPLPPRSLLIMWGSARYEWEHSVWRQDITARRLVLAYRELTPPYLEGGEHHALGNQILERAGLWGASDQATL